MKNLEKTTDIIQDDNSIRKVEFSKQIKPKIEGFKTKTIKVSLVSRKKDDTFTLSIISDKDVYCGGCTSEQINLTRDDLINLRDELTKSINNDW